MKANGIKTYRGFNGQDFMISGSDYNALKRNLTHPTSPKPVAGTDALLKYTSMKRDAQLGRISDKEAEDYRRSVTGKTSNKSKNDAKKRVFVNQAKKLSEDVQNQKFKEMQNEKDRSAVSNNRSIMQYISIQFDRLITRINDKTTRVSPELQTGLSKMKEQIEAAVLEFMNGCYFPYMTERLKVVMSKYESQVVAAVVECCDVIGDQLSENEAKAIMAQCYRELADGRLNEYRINYFISTRWETACSHKIANN